MNASRHEIFGKNEEIRLAEAIIVPPEYQTGTVKCRVVYGEEIDSISFEHYQRRTIRSLKLIRSDDAFYEHKLCDRSLFEQLLLERGTCDDILILKNGMITDTSFSNVAFFDGSGWITPVSPLLRGTKREKLLDDGIIEEENVHVSDLGRFRHLSLINAMLDIRDVIINVDRIM